MGISNVLETQYTKIKKWHDEKEIYLAKSRFSDNLFIWKEVDIHQKELYQQLMKYSFPGCVKIFGVYPQKEKCVIIQEYIQGDTIQELIDKNGVFSEREAAAIIRDLCDILTLLHSYNIVHKDIQSNNIMITSDGVVKLIDFGCSRYYDESKKVDTYLMGTVGYAAPEQFGLKQTDCRTDIYSLGVLFHVLLTGKLLAEGGNIQKRRYRKIIKRCTQIDWQKRYNSCTEIKEDLMERTAQYVAKNILQQFPGFRERDRKYKWWILLCVYPVSAIYIKEIVQGIRQMNLMPVATVFFSAVVLLLLFVVPFVMLTDIFNIRTKIFKRSTLSKKEIIRITIAIIWISISLVGVILAIYYA